MSGKSSLKKFFKKIKFFLKKVLTNRIECVIIYERQGDAGVAQLVEQLICNQQVGGSNPSTSSRLKRGLFKRQPLHMGEFQSGQMGQTVNLLFRLRWFESTLSHQIMCLILLSGTFFLVFMRVCGLFSVSKKDWCPITVIPVFRDICKAKRSFHLIFQAGNSAFLRLPLFFPVVGTVKVFARYIDRLTKIPK